VLVPDLLKRVRSVVEGNPTGAAVRDCDGEWTFDDLWAASTDIAASLREVVSADPSGLQAVGIALPRSRWFVAALLGVMRAGGTCVVLDQSLLLERLDFMARDAGIRALLTVGGSSALDGLAVRVIDVEAAVATSEIDATALAPPQVAYLVYTSGSTGEPKAVSFRYDALSNLIDWQLAELTVPSPTVAHFASLSFDVSYQEIFVALASGGLLVCVDDPVRRDPEMLWDVLASEKIQLLYLPFVSLRSLAKVSSRLDRRTRPPLREVITAGEQLQCDRAVTYLFAELLPGCRLVNQYGPAETHVVSWFRLPADPEQWPALPPIGEPIANVAVEVCDPTGRVLPPGEVGEIRVRGVAVADGYWRRPELTAERFANDRAERVYWTGDLGQTKIDGTLIYLGRRDRQLKIGGFRVEPGAIESALVDLPGVEEAVVLPVAAPSGELELVAVVTGEVANDQLLRSLRSHLQSHEIPRRIIHRDHLPQTATGKVDRDRIAASLDESAAQGLTDATVESVVAAVLGIESDGHRTFVELGGDSIGAIHAVVAIEDQLGLDVSISELLADVPLAELVGRPRRRLLRLKDSGEWEHVSPGERQMLLAELFDADRQPPLAAGEIVVDGEIDVQRLQEAMRLVVAKHSALRTVFRLDGRDFRRRTEPEAPKQLVEFAPQTTLVEARRQMLAAKGSSATPPGLSVGVVHDGAATVLIVVTHHVVCDGWSLGIVADELARAYTTGELTEREPAAFANYIEGKAVASAAAAVASTPHLLPFARRSSQPPALRRTPFDFTMAERARIDQIAQGHRATSFAVVVAAWGRTLAQFCDVDQLLIATSLLARHPSALEIVGNFANTVPLRVGSECSVAEASAELRRAHTDQFVPFEALVQAVGPARQAGVHPLAQVLIVQQPRRIDALRFGASRALAFVRFDLGEPEPTGFDLVIGLDDDPTRCHGHIDYNRAVLNDHEITELLRQFKLASQSDANIERRLRV
jgi:amino acid adenylation domain-containing protein